MFMDDILSKVMWTKLLMQEQGRKIIENMIYREHKVNKNGN